MSVLSALAALKLQPTMCVMRDAEIICMELQPQSDVSWASWYGNSLWNVPNVAAMLLDKLG